MSWLRRFIASLPTGRRQDTINQASKNAHYSGPSETYTIAVPSRTGVMPSKKGQPDLSIAAGVNSARDAQSYTSTLERSGAPTRYLAVGNLNDRRGYTTVIRAFALSGKLGDRLTIIGFGRYRRRLEKWTRALGIEAIVDFSDAVPNNIIDLNLFDAVLIVSDEPQHTSTFILSVICRKTTLVIPDNHSQFGSVVSCLPSAYIAKSYDTLSYALAISKISKP